MLIGHFQQKDNMKEVMIPASLAKRSITSVLPMDGLAAITGNSPSEAIRHSIKLF
ncbi:hypothetical protein [Bacillus niameyensis]|uniref:hypothetical protein n=1 Tax=Bacillus niameyensis TaxID=1522308 RepID=UPI001E64CCB3|nr:hypothetical protein [Bacillus niameyensis]